MSDGIGRVTWWGFSPAFSLLSLAHERIEAAQTEAAEAAETAETAPSVVGELSGIDALMQASTLESRPSKGDVNFLLVGAGDCRHILSTIVDAKRLEGVRVNIYVLESRIEVLARHLLLTSIALQKKLAGLETRMHFFLELFGNTFISPSTKSLLEKEATFLIDMITDPDRMQEVMPWASAQRLKFKERDELEAVFKFWRAASPKAFPVTELWDERLRLQHKQRYDVRDNIFDWDHAMNLSEKCAFIKGRHYKAWRETGMAFDDGSLRSAMDEPNYTLASGEVIKTRKGVVAKRGYWGDMVTGPYVSFGTDAGACKQLTEKRNGKLHYSAVDVTKFNVFQTLARISVDADVNASLVPTATGDDYVLAVDDDGRKSGRADDDDDDDDDDADKKDLGDFFETNVKVHFLSPAAGIAEMLRKPKYHAMFDAAYFSNSMVHLLTSDIGKLLRGDRCRIACETAKYMLVLNKEQTTTFNEKVVGLAKAARFRPLAEPQVHGDIMLFVRETPS